MSFDIDTDIPVIAEYASQFGQSKAHIREFIRFLVRQTTAYKELEGQLKALKHQTEVVKDELAAYVAAETPEVD